MHTVRARSWLAAVAVGLLGGLIYSAAPAVASTPGCSSLGPSCGDNVNVFGNAWDVRGQLAAVNNPVIAYPNGTADPATDFRRTGGATGPWRYEYAPRGVASGLCVSDPGTHLLVLRGCNTSNYQLFRAGHVNSVGTQLVNVAFNRAVTTNGTRNQLSTGGSYTGGSYFKWLGGPVAGATDMGFSLYGPTDSSATCAGGNEVLSAGSVGPTGAFILVKNAPADTPAAAPTWESNKYDGAGDPRWVIELHNGQIIFGYPSTAGAVTSASTWTWANGSFTGSYSGAVANAKAGGSDDWVTAAFIVLDSGDRALNPVTFTDVQYNGQHFSC